MNQQDIEQVVKVVLLKMQSSDTPPAAVHEILGVFASLDHCCGSQSRPARVKAWQCAS